MPALTRFYGLRPEDIDRMTLREVSEYVTQLEQQQPTMTEVPDGG